MAGFAAFVPDQPPGDLVYSAADGGAWFGFSQIACRPAPTFLTTSQLFESAPEQALPSTSATGFGAPSAGTITVAVTLPGMSSRSSNLPRALLAEMPTGPRMVGTTPCA